MLKQIETNRWTTIGDMAEQHVVSTKTIRRDLAALMEAGFPLYDERYEGKCIGGSATSTKGCRSTTLSLSETAALYFSKKLVVNLAAPAVFRRHCVRFQEDRERVPGSQH